MNSVFRKILLFTISLVIFPSLSYAATTLNPGDLMIITVNSDTSYPGGVNSNAFDFVSKVDIEEGTEIYFTDVGWTGVAWRNPSGEGVLRYTTPVGGLTRGAVIRYDDSLAATAPWTRLSLNSTTGALTQGGSYDPAATGDNILVFQGSTLSPDFIYGIGWGNNTPWITTGIASANNSYIPAVLSGAASTLVTLGNLDNYQYNCSITGLSSSSLSSSISLGSNWNSNDTIMFGSSPCIFDATNPRVNSVTRFNPLSSTTNESSVTFRVEFSEAVTDVSIEDFITSPSSLSATISNVVAISSSVYEITVQSYSGEGDINLDISSSHNIKDLSGNALVNAISVGADESYTLDTLLPATPVITSPASVADNSLPVITGTTEANNVIDLVINGTSYSTTADSLGNWSITTTVSLTEGVYPYTVTVTDLFGNTSAVLNTSITLTTTPQTSNTQSSAVRYTCKDPKATNYEQFGRHKPSLCKYTETTALVNTLTPSTDNPFGGNQCSAELLITDNMKNGDTNGVYSSYNKGKVTQISILQAHINRILGDEYTQAAGPVDNYFRTKTKLGVERLQQRLNQLLPDMKPLVIDGIVGTYTKKAINMSC